MILERVKNIFEFIDFLESNKKEYIETYVPLTNKVLQLSNERSKLMPTNNYKKKQQYDIIQKKMEEPCSLINSNVVKPILQRLLDLKIWDGDDTYASIWNNNVGAMHEQTQNFADADVEEIKSYKQRYLDFRTETKTVFLSLALMFGNLDEILKILFDFFKDVEANEFEPFEAKTIQVNSTDEVLPHHLRETQEVKKNSRCTSETFKADISELCEKCPLVEIIKNGIEKHIVFQAIQKKEILTKDQFKRYVEGEIDNASKEMEKVHNIELQNPEDLKIKGNRIEVYIWNKERIKALNRLLESDQNEKINNEQLSNGKDAVIQNGERVFNDLGELIEYQKASEIKYYDERVKQIDENGKPLFLEAFNHSLGVDKLMTLQRQLQQAIAAYEHSIKNDGFTFAAHPHLKENLNKKLSDTIEDFKRALTIVETKIQHKQISPNKEDDPYKLTYSGDNSIQFKDQKVFFPFECHSLANLICSLREKLIDLNVCSTDLQSFPQQIFEDTELKNHPHLAGWIYNIIEAWVVDVESGIHHNKKKRLFDTFLDLCSQKAMAAKPLNENGNTIEGFLFFMLNKRSKNNRVIIEKKEFERLVGYTKSFIETGNVPKKLDPIKSVNMNKEDIIYTFRELYKEFKTEQKGKFPFEFFNFLNTVFLQLSVDGFSKENYRDSFIYKKGANPTSEYKSLKKV